jgi:hypothetical protein
MYIQHGDTLYFPDIIPDGLPQLKTDIVQEGEATGHAHRLIGEDYVLFEEPVNQIKFLRVLKPTALRHEEHKEILLPSGDYRIGIVREYDHFKEEARKVAD